MRSKTKKNTSSPVCKGLTFKDCELSILRQAVDEAETIQGESKVNSPEVKKIIHIVEKFIQQSNVICYGGTAINNIIPKEDQFYDKSTEIPDYDFYSPNALEDAKKLANIYHKAGFTEVEAKSGQHHGTYKVYVNFIPVADITYMPPALFRMVKKDAIKVDGILYAPANLLRMGMYLELSRPAGDVSRWEKVLKRLILLNKNHPIDVRGCNHIELTRPMEHNHPENRDKIYNILLNSFIDQDSVFFGGYALYLYSKYLPEHEKPKIKHVPDFDVLAEDPGATAEQVKENLTRAGITNVKIVKRPGIGEIISPHYEIKVNGDSVAFIYEPLGCHNYNIVHKNHKDIKIATIDTMLSFWLAFLYADREYYNHDRILCLSNFLFDIQKHHRTEQDGLLKRFSMNCIGHQSTLEEMRAEKAAKYNELDKSDPEYEEWFLNYQPSKMLTKKSTINSSKNSSKKSTKTMSKHKYLKKSMRKTRRKHK